MNSKSTDFSGGAAVEYNPEDDVPATEAERVMKMNEERLFESPDVSGVGVGQNAIGEDAIVVYLKRASAASSLPKSIDGIDIVTEVTGEIDAY